MFQSKSRGGFTLFMQFHPVMCRHEESDFYFLKRPSNLADALVRDNPEVIEECMMPVEALNENGRRTMRSIEVKASKLRDGEVAIVDLNSISSSQSIMKSNNVKFLIHAVGPDCRMDKFNVSFDDTEEQALEKITARKSVLEGSYVASLNKALEKGVTTIALPALSVGIFQYPEEEAAQVIASTLLRFEDRFEDISIVAMDPRNPDKRPRILDLIEQNLLQEMDKNDSPQNSPRASSGSPLPTNNSLGNFK